MDDRRVFERINTRLPVRFLAPSSGREGKAETIDVSAKGIGLVADKELQSHTALEMWLDMPDKGEPLYTRGEVVWLKEVEPNQFRMGVELEKADLMGMSRVLRTI